MSLPFIRFLARESSVSFPKLLGRTNALKEANLTSLQAIWNSDRSRLSDILGNDNESDRILHAIKRQSSKQYKAKHLTPTTVPLESHGSGQHDVLSHTKLEESLSLPNSNVSVSELMEMTVHAESNVFTAAYIVTFLGCVCPHLSMSSRFTLAGAYLAAKYKYRDLPSVFDIAEARNHGAIDGDSRTIASTSTVEVLGQTITVAQQNIPEPAVDQISSPSCQPKLDDPNVAFWAVDPQLLEIYYDSLATTDIEQQSSIVVPVFSPHAVHKMLDNVKPLAHSKFSHASKVNQRRMDSRYKMHKERQKEHLNFLLRALELLFKSWMRPSSHLAVLAEMDQQTPNDVNTKGRNLTQLEGQRLHEYGAVWLQELSRNPRYQVPLKKILDLRRGDSVEPKPTNRERKMKPAPEDVEVNIYEQDPVKRLIKLREQVDLKDGSLL